MEGAFCENNGTTMVIQDVNIDERKKTQKENPYHHKRSSKWLMNVSA